MRGHLPTSHLTATDIPPEDAPWREVSDFGHRFHAYKVAGSLQRVAELTLATHDRWAEDATLPADPDRLRLALFHTVRAAGDDPDADTERWARTLVAAIRDAVPS